VLVKQQLSVCPSGVNLAELGARRHSVAQEMAQPEESHQERNGLPVERIRRLVGHLIELGAACEGHGVDVGGGDPDDDLRTITAVLGLLEEHLERQRQRQLDPLHGTILDLIADTYRASKSLTAYELQTHLIEKFRFLGVELIPDELDEIVVPWDVEKAGARQAAVARSYGPANNTSADEGPEEVTIKESGGPVDAAKKTLGSVLKRGTRNLGTTRQRTLKAPMARVAFGRWVSASARSKYAQEVCTLWQRVQEAAALEKPLSGTLSSLRRLGEESGMTVDAFVERFTLDLFTTTDGLLAILSAESRTPQLLEIQRQFHERLSFRVALYSMFIAVDLKSADERLARMTPMNERIRGAAQSLITTLRSGIEESVGAAHRELQLAVAADTLELARAHLADHFRTLRGDS
jgi:hypothetical protein